ncbi:MAG: ABC transporter substrate-binding protein [Proteobacteria bacterium]|nr:ABC transporter substrate-binding protein [Pseudomonadota bacterium]
MTDAARALGAALLLAAMLTPAQAADPIRIGVIYPLSGNAASAGASAKDAVELGVELINNVHAELKGMPLSGSLGLPRLNSAKIELVSADHQGNPSVGQSQTLRLITQEKVVAMLGAYHSSVAVTATAVAERQGIPFLVADSVALNITGRGFKWIFRTGPIASDFAIAYTQFLSQMKQSGKKIDSVMIVNENTEYGTSVAGSIIETAKKAGLNIAGQIPYNANSADVSAQVLQLKDKRPDVVIFISYTSDTILYFKTMKSLDYMPPMIIGDDAGFSDPAFIPSVGELAQAVMNRSAWDIGKPGSNTHRINELFKAKTGRDLDDTSARWMQGFLVLCEAINRAGSTDPAKIQQALQRTDLRPEQLMIGYRGVRFDDTGQNVEAATYLTQLHGTEYKAVWPQQRATAPLKWPMTGWKN